MSLYLFRGADIPDHEEAKHDLLLREELCGVAVLVSFRELLFAGALKLLYTCNLE